MKGLAETEDGVSATIDARRVISFKASKLMKERINKSEKH